MQRLFGLARARLEGSVVIGIELSRFCALRLACRPGERPPCAERPPGRGHGCEEQGDPRPRGRAEVARGRRRRQERDACGRRDSEHPHRRTNPHKSLTVQPTALAILYAFSSVGELYPFSMFTIPVGDTPDAFARSSCVIRASVRATRIRCPTAFLKSVIPFSFVPIHSTFGRTIRLRTRRT